MKAHATDPFAARFGQAEFRVRGTRCPAEGKFVGIEPPEVTVMDEIPTCSYCGSITVADFLRLLQIPGTHYSGSDWKYGYPHKFYLDYNCEAYRRYYSGRNHTDANGLRVVETKWVTSTSRNHKLYTAHLLDATDEELALWEKVAKPLLGINFFRTDGTIKYSAPMPGYQSGGTVGGQPQARTAGAPPIPAPPVIQDRDPGDEDPV